MTGSVGASLRLDLRSDESCRSEEAHETTRAANPPRFRCGIDIGGTFTDLVAVSSDGQRRAAKILTTYPSPAPGVLAGLEELLPPQGWGRLDQIVHGTTLAANLVLEGKGALTSLMTTKGFRDVLEMRRGNRVLYDLHFNFPSPLVPRHRRFEIDERVLADGDVWVPISRESVALAWSAAEAAGTEAIAVCLLHSYRNSVHEREVLNTLRRLGCDLPITLSSEISGEMGEYERTSTAVVNAYVQPAVSRYLAELADSLEAMGFAGDFYIMLSHGGIAPRDTAERQPVRVIESGPAAGMISAAKIATRVQQQAIAFDMGGTTAKACLVSQAGTPLRATFEIASEHKLERGTGYPLNVPSVDLSEIGAGGGSIAWVDQLGLLQVGPKSAGASPGPACYPGGGSEPTVTDANLVLGLLNGDYFLGGRMPLSRERSLSAIAAVANQAKLSTLQAARAIHELVNENMARAIRLHALNRGEEPSRYALIAFGGAAPVHAQQLADKLDITTVVIPELAGVQSAEGLLTAPLSMTVASSFVVEVQQDVPALLEREIARLKEQALDLLRSDRSREIAVDADMRYVGQSHHVKVPLDVASIATEGTAGLRARFEKEYERHFLRTNPDVAAEIVALNLHATVHSPDAIVPGSIGSPPDIPVGEREIFLPGHGAVTARVVRREILEVGAQVRGPALIEDLHTTIVVGPGHCAEVDQWRAVVMRASA